MHPIEICILVLLLGGAVIGFKKGLINSILFLIGITVTFVLLIRFAPMVQAGLLLRASFSPLFSSVLAKILIILLAVLLFAILKILMGYIGKAISLNFLNRLLGAIFNMFSMYVVILILLYFIDIIPDLREVRTYLTHSKITNDSYKIINYLKKDYNELIPPQYRK